MVLLMQRMEPTPLDNLDQLLNKYSDKEASNDHEEYLSHNQCIYSHLLSNWGYRIELPVLPQKLEMEKKAKMAFAKFLSF